MENQKQVGGSSLDHLFGPRHSSSSSSSSSSSGIFGSIFSTASTGQGRGTAFHGHQVGTTGRYGNPDNTTKGSKGENSCVSGKEKSSVYQNETVEPSYLSSSIFYGGQENYSPKTSNSESQHMFKKDGGDDDANGNNSNGATRGNWWQGSLYY